ncbi:MAG: DedA family protein [Proteobacteria bacterium]|nr:DedA family protein [Pseudomonadota bacterium]
MKIFSYLYNKVYTWSQHRHAPYLLSVVSFTESSMFPVPPDVMLIPMAIAQPARIWRYAGITVISAVLGGILGYILGAVFQELVSPLIQKMGYGPAFDQAVSWFKQWGMWMVIFGGFCPIPFKLFTIAAGTLHMPFIPFIMASIISRSIRFFGVAGLIVYWGGERIQRHLNRYIDIAGWFVVSIAAIAYCIWHFV